MRIGFGAGVFSFVRGNRVVFVQMSHPSGMLEVTVFAEMLSEARGLLDSSQPLVVTVDVHSGEENLRLTGAID